jgi:2-methylisocitrate lyase-like PEP mutase family enzyme
MMSSTIAEKAAHFKALHDGPAFVIPNPWDAGTARILAGMGFQSLATSSAAAAASIGRKDGELSRVEAIAHAKMIADSTDLPVSGDLENGFGGKPEDVALTVKQAAEAGLTGCTIEDTTRDPAHPLFDFNLAVERIAAGAEAAKMLKFPFMLTARAHGLLFDSASMDAVIQRLQAFERAGANVLFAPGLSDVAAVRLVCASVSKPVNFMVGIPGKSFPIPELVAAGVKRISLATSLYRAAMTGFLDAVREIQESGEFSFLDRSVTTAELIKRMNS